MPLQCTSGRSSVKQRRDRRLAEDGDVIDAANRGNELGAYRRGQDWTAGPLRTCGEIVVDGDDKTIGLRGGGPQISNMADVQEVEAAVGKRNRASG